MAALIAVPLGLLIGAVLGLVGAGGSIIAIPALVYGVGLSPAQAIPSSLIVVGFAAITAILPRIRNNIDWTTALLIGAAGIPAAWLGAATSRLIDPNMLLLAFAALMVVAAVRMLTAKPGNAATDGSETRRMRTFIPKAVAVGVAVGFLTGLFGIGGGFIITPALILLLGLRAGKAVGTSLVIIIINSAAGITAHLGNLDINWPVVLTFTGAAVVGSLIAARFANKLPDRTIKITFGIIVLAVAVFVAGSSITALVTA
jgi:hypothetical protein